MAYNTQDNKICYILEPCYELPLSKDKMMTCVTVEKYDYLRGIVYFENDINKTLWLIKWVDSLREFYNKHKIIRDLHLDYTQLPNPTYMLDKHNNLIR